LKLLRPRRHRAVHHPRRPWMTPFSMSIRPETAQRRDPSQCNGLTASGQDRNKKAEPPLKPTSVPIRLRQEPPALMHEAFAFSPGGLGDEPGSMRQPDRGAASVGSGVTRHGPQAPSSSWMRGGCEVAPGARGPRRRLPVQLFRARQRYRRADALQLAADRESRPADAPLAAAASPPHRIHRRARGVPRQPPGRRRPIGLPRPAGRHRGKACLRNLPNGCRRRHHGGYRCARTRQNRSRAQGVGRLGDAPSCSAVDTILWMSQGLIEILKTRGLLPRSRNV
jgi:hypothetical protein